MRMILKYGTADYISSNFLKATFHKLYLILSWVLCLILLWLSLECNIYSDNKMLPQPYYRYTELWFMIEFYDDFPRQKLSSLDFSLPNLETNEVMKNDDILQYFFWYLLGVCISYTRSLTFFPTYDNYFPNHWSTQNSFTFGIGPAGPLTFVLIY